MPNLAALAHRDGDFKHSICLQGWATLHMAFAVAVQLVAQFVGLGGILEVCRGRCCKEVADSVRGAAPRE